MSEPREYEIVAFRCTDRKRDGTPLVSKRGDPMWSVDVKIRERPDTWINGLVFRKPDDWTGSKQKLILEITEYNGQKYPKFKMPRSDNLSTERLTQMTTLLMSIDARLERIERSIQDGYLRGVSQADWMDERGEENRTNRRTD